MSLSGPVCVVGGGLAGCEAAWQLGKRGVRVVLFEMKPRRFSAAHRSPRLAELVCSNSLRSAATENAVGLLKEEMRRLESLFMAAADATAVPAGKALAVDREAFSAFVEERLTSLAPVVEIVREEVTEIPAGGPCILAPGPLASEALSRAMADVVGGSYLYFYDAISPIVEADSIDHQKVFRASRYGEGEGDYLNCPLTEEEYRLFHRAVLAGEKVPLREFEEARFFEGCLPIEVLAQRGEMTLAFGPMKPVGLTDPRTGRQPFAVVQLRRENREGTLYNLVGFQTRLTWTEQARIFRTIPGLEKAVFARWGSMHRNTFINAPALLTPRLHLREEPRIYLAGQITGVEGYVESAAMGLLAGLSVLARLEGRDFAPPPPTTAHGALVAHITSASAKDFQPMNVNFGLFTPPPHRIAPRYRGAFYRDRALADLEAWKRSNLRP